MSQFDRVNQTVDNRLVLVTSWFDDTTQTWHASAPRYAHVEGITNTAQIQCENRLQAIEAVLTALRSHFHS